MFISLADREHERLQTSLAPAHGVPAWIGIRPHEVMYDPKFFGFSAVQPWRSLCSPFCTDPTSTLRPADGVDRAAGNVGAWGTKQRVGGAGGQLLGKVKEFAGDVTGDEQTSNEGAFDQAAGAVRNAAGQAAQALGSTIHDLNK